MTSPVDVEVDVLTYLGADGRITFKGVPLQLIYPNRDNRKDDPVKIPRIAVDSTAYSIRTLGLSTDAILRSSLVLTVVTASGGYLNDRNAILRDIYQKFPLHTEIGGAIITRPAEVRPGYRDGNEYRTPVFIEYTAIIEN